MTKTLRKSSPALGLVELGAGYPIVPMAKSMLSQRNKKIIAVMFYFNKKITSCRLFFNIIRVQHFNKIAVFNEIFLFDKYEITSRHKLSLKLFKRNGNT
jgi:hypothetical protein